MKILYKQQNHSRLHSGLQKLSLILVMMLFGFSTAFGQTLTSDSPVCTSEALTLTFDPQGCGATQVVFTGPGITPPGVTVGSSPFVHSVANVLVQTGTYTATVTGGTCGTTYTTEVWKGKPAKPVISGTNRACVNEVTSYSTPQIPGLTYAWSISQDGVYGDLGDATISNGVVSVSVKWLSGAVGNSAWVKVTATNDCGGTPSDSYNVSVYDNPITPTATLSSNTYCHGGDGVTVTVDNVENNNTYNLIRIPGDVVVDTHVASGTASFDFANVKVANDGNPAEQSSTFYVQGINPNVCFAQTTDFTITKYAEPTVLFSVNDVNASYQSHYYFCYDKDITVKLSEILSPNPAGQVDITWTVSPDPDGLLSGSLTDVEAGDVLFGPDKLDAGTYTVNLTYLEDENGCKPTDYSIYELYVTIWEEPTLDITIDGTSVFGTTQEYCYDEDIDLTIAGGDGISRWTFDWQVEDNLGNPVPGFVKTGDWVEDTPEVKNWNASVLTPGTYKVRITSLVDGNGCVASPATIATHFVNLVIHPEPELELIIAGESVGFNFNKTYCHDQVMSFALGTDMVSGAYDLQTITWTVSPEVTGIGLEGGTQTNVGAGFNFGFTAQTLPPNTYTFTITEFKDANGCEPSNYAPYTATITIRPEPTLNITLDPVVTDNKYCWDDVVNIDMQGDVGTSPWEVTWAVSGPSGFTDGGTMNGSGGNWDWDLSTYDEGVYNFTITALSDDFPCSTSQNTLDTYDFSIEKLTKPAPDAGDDHTVCNSSSYTLQGAYASIPGFPSFASWSKLSGPGTAMFDPGLLNPEVTVDVAGEYEFEFVQEYGNGCTYSDTVAITFLKGTNADAYTIDPMANIDAVAGAPVVTKFTYNLPTPDVNADANIIMDGLFEITSGGPWPTGATITEVRRVQAITTTWFPVINGDLSGKDHVFLSDIINLSNPLFNNSLNSYPWVITIADVDGGTYEMKVSLITYITKPTDLGTDCFATLDAKTYTLTYDDAVITAPVDPVEACYDDVSQLHTLDFAISIAYPTINNIDVADEITTDALITITAGNQFNNGATLLWGYNAPATNASATNIDGKISFYLSDIVGSSAPLNGHSGVTDTWNLIVTGVDPGAYELKIDALADITVVEAANIRSSTGTSFPMPTLAEYIDYEYDYATDDWKMNVIGALNVTMADTPDISTVTGAPVIVPFTTSYGDLASQNIDSSVQADARFSTAEGGGFPAGAVIEKIEFVGGASFDLSYSIAGKTEVFLSQVLGTSSPLAGHHGVTVEILATISGVNTAVADFTTTVEAVAWVNSPYGTPAGCYSPMASDDVDVTWADMTVSAPNATIVCEGTPSVVNFDIDYPTLAENPNEIVVDGEFSFDVAIPNTVSIAWSYNGSSPTTYNCPGWAANQKVLFSTILGSGPNPLQGHSGLHIDLDFTISGLEDGVYTLTSKHLASITGETGTHDLVTSATTTVVDVYETPDATITMVTTAEVYSGSTHQYQVAVPIDGSPTYSWSSDQSSSDVIITNTSDRQPSIEFVWPFTGTVVLTCVVDNGICSDSKTLDVEVLPNLLAGQVKYYNADESPMPSPFMANDYGQPIPDYFYVALIEKGQYNPESDYPFDYDLEYDVVQERYVELTPGQYYAAESAFGFEYNLDPEAEYYVVVWDGGFYEEYGYNVDGDLGQNWTWNNWGGVNGTDALMIQHMVVGNQINIFNNMQHIGDNNATPFEYGFFAFGAADVNASSSISGLDALLTQRRAVGLIQKFINDKPNFVVSGTVKDADIGSIVYDGSTVELFRIFNDELPAIDFTKAGTDYIFGENAIDHNYFSDPITFGTGEKFMNIYYNAAADINASYVPLYGGFKDAPAIDLTFEGELAAAPGEEVTIPINIDRYADLGALSLGLNYRNDLIEVIGLNYGEDFAYVNHEEGTVSIAWASVDGLSLNADDMVAEITVRVLAEIEPSTRLFELNGFTELATVDAEVIEGVNFKSLSLNTNATHANGVLDVNVYPNPFKAVSTISYNMPEAGTVSLVVYNKIGQVVKTFVAGYQEAGIHKVEINDSDLVGTGVYYYKLEVSGESATHSATNSIILMK